MSVRSEPAGMPPTPMMAGMEIAPTSLPATGNDHVTATINAAQSADSALGDVCVPPSGLAPKSGSLTCG